MKRVWLTAFVFWAVMSALICAFYPLLVFDSIARYAPMADAFARGDWQLAFHPRFGVLFPPLTGGLVRAFGVSGDHACQIVSTAFLAFSIVPVWVIAARVFNDRRIAWVTAVLVLVATEYLTYIEDGLRDPCRTLGLALCTVAFLNRRSAVMALGVFLLATVKVDLFAFSCVLLAAWCVTCLLRRAWTALLLPILSWTVGTLLMCALTYQSAGYFLPMAQFVKLYLKLTGGAL